MAPMRNGSLTRVANALAAPPKSTPAPPRAPFFGVWPGSRLISIMSRPSRIGSGDLAERQPDGKHQQRSDIIDDERFESVVTVTEALQRSRERDGEAQPRGERLVETGDARAATAAVGGLELRGGARRAREERGRALDADRDLLAARLGDRLEVRRLLVALEERVGLFGAQA